MLVHQSVDGYDRQRVGLQIEAVGEVPPTAETLAEQRDYFDTSKFGKSAKGHDFPAALSDRERLGLLEYLKTL